MVFSNSSWSYFNTNYTNGTGYSLASHIKTYVMFQFHNNSNRTLKLYNISYNTNICNTADYSSLIYLTKLIPVIQHFYNNSFKAAMFQSSNQKAEHLFKVLVIGDLGVGKTSFIKRYVHQFFSVHYRATVCLLCSVYTNYYSL